VRDDLGQGERGGIRVELSLHDFQVRRDAPQVFVGGLVGQVSQAQRLPDFTRGKEFLEL
jgi:hypothetical protein